MVYMSEEVKQMLQAEVATGAELKLACGLTSSYVLDLSRLLRNPEFRELVKPMMPTFHCDAIGGALSGSDLVASLFDKKWFGVRKEAKERGYDRGVITGCLSRGDKVVLVEDICTSGQSLERAIKAVIELGAEPIGLFSLVTREELRGLQKLGEKYNLPTISLFYIKDGVIL